jgi:thiamine pyrophosphokinase
MEQVLIIANGELDQATAARIQRIAPDGVIAVDGGADHCLALALKPSLILGDLDSLEPQTLAHFVRLGVPIERHPEQKDATDLELALLRAAQEGAKHIILAGALGGRLDMTLSNVLLLTDPRLRHVRVELWQDRETAWLLRPPGGTVSGQPGDTLSLIPLLGDATGITTEGLSYPLRDEILILGLTRGVSNLLAGTTAVVHLREGCLLAVHNPGRA